MHDIVGWPDAMKKPMIDECIHLWYCSKVTSHSLAISMLEPRMLAALVSPYWHTLLV